MGFESFLGNAQVKENLRRSLSNNRISHFYLISGPAGSGKHTLARLLAAAILCQDRGKPCLSCAACRKVMSGVHPDYITVEDPEHKAVAVKIVREAREDIFIRPNEAEYKVYLFPQELGIEGQNALLKILEEPPSYGVFILLSENPEQLLPTVRSRCTELKLTALPEKELRDALRREFPNAGEEALQAAMLRSGGFLGQAMALLRDGGQISPQTEGFAAAVAEKNNLLLTQTLAPMEKWKRDQLLPELQQWQQLIMDAMLSRSGMPAVSQEARRIGEARSPRELSAMQESIAKAIEYTQSNVSTGAVCGWLVWELR
jgi:DNA polymerase-3 subunit delta'